jgi:hypothetical protein
MESGLISGTLYIFFHFSATAALIASSLFMVAILASQVSQFNPQQAISVFIFLNFN